MQTAKNLGAWEQAGANLELTGRGDLVPDDVERLVPPTLEIQAGKSE